MMNSKIQEQTGKTFSVHPALIYSIITKQASGLHKALLELAMNSVDAGATSIKITLDNNGFTFLDNGKGFKDIDEITSCFETFGTPHEHDGDAEYGRYRLGRAQIMCYCKTNWHTKHICMDVDLKKELDQDDQEIPLGYTLSSTPEFIDGCKITGVFYEPRNVGDVNDLDSTSIYADPNSIKQVIPAFSKMVKYLPVPVEINGVVVNKVLSEQAVLDKNDEAIFLLNQTIYPSIDNENTHGVVNVYNKGVYAYQIKSKYFSGDAVSIPAIDLNIARNAAKTTCHVAKSISRKVSQLDQKIDLNYMKTKRSDSSNLDVDVGNFVLEFWKGILGFKSINWLEFGDAISQKIFIQGNDTKISFEDIFKQLIQRKKKIDQSIRKIEPQLYYYDFADFNDVVNNQRDKICLKYGLLTAKIFPQIGFLKKVNHQVFFPTAMLSAWEFKVRQKRNHQHWILGIDKTVDIINCISTSFKGLQDNEDVGIIYSLLLQHLLKVYTIYQRLNDPQSTYYLNGLTPENILSFEKLDFINTFFSQPILPVSKINVSEFEDEYKPKKATLTPYEKIIADSLNVVARYYGLRYIPKVCFKFIDDDNSNKFGMMSDLKVEILVNDDGENGVAAWTNGVDLIVFEDKYFKACVATGDFDSLIFVLFHELSHNDNSADTLTHGASFYFVFLMTFVNNYQWIVSRFHEEITRRIMKKLDSKNDIESLAIPEKVLVTLFQRQVDKLLSYTE